MGIPRLRFSVRCFMVMIATCAFLFSPLMFGRRFAYLKGKESEWAMLEAACIRDAKKWEHEIKRCEADVKTMRKMGLPEDIVKSFETMPIYYEELGREKRLTRVAARWKAIYQRAMFHPWEQVPVDPLDQ